MTDAIYYFIQDFEVLTSIIPVLALLVTKNKARRKLRRVLYLLATSWMVAEGLSWILARNGYNTFLVFNIYNSISTVGYFLFFSVALPKLITQNRVILFSFVYLITFWTIIIVTNSYFESKTIVNILASAIPFFLALLTFYSIAREATMVNLVKEPIYWVISAILIHFGLGLVAIISLESISKSAEMILYIWPLVLVSNIIHNFIFTVGIWKTNRV